MAIRDQVLAGLPLQDCLIVDGHMHNARLAPFFSRFGHYHDLAAQMDAIGVNCGIVSNLWNTGEVWQQYREMEQLFQAYPGRFFGYLAPNPNLPSYFDELNAYAADPNYVGIKLHPFLHGIDLMSPQYRATYDFAAQHKLPVLIHTWGMADMHRFSEIASVYPDTVLILGHSGGDEDALQKAIELAAEHKNIYLDTACSYVWQGAVEAMVHGAGAAKVLYGSDAYWNSMEAAIGRIALGELTEAEKCQILGENANRIFHLRKKGAQQ